MKHDPGALLLAMPDVFPWVRHLSTEEVRAFTVALVAALSDAAELDLDVSAYEVIAGWRATARIKADPEQYEDGGAAHRRPWPGGGQILEP
jgi:hypothetical protein